MNSISNRAIAEFANKKKGENIVRTVTLFGKNTATYKFALTHALLHQNAKSELRYDDLTEHFVREMFAHYTINSHQYKAGNNSTTTAFDKFKASEQSIFDFENLITITKGTIYKFVFDAYQNIGGGSLANDYRLFENDKTERKIILTDRLTEILENRYLKNVLLEENQARWRVVEEAWRTTLSPNLITFDATNGFFYSTNKMLPGRVMLRSAVATLLPYQQGKCFYCNKILNINSLHSEGDFPDVDHFLPFSYIRNSENLSGANINGVWNLVIACQECNRGDYGKFGIPPDVKFFQALLDRNLLFIEEHRHSLKNSILLSLNVSDREGIQKKMIDLYSEFRVFKTWQPKYYHH